MEVRTYNLTKETSALITCIEQCTELHSNILEALEMYYDERQIAFTGVEEDKEKIGYDLFNAIQKVQDELFKLAKEEVIQNLCTTSKDKEI